MESDDFPVVEAAARASMVAGPLFLVLLMLFGYVDSAPDSYPVTFRDLPSIPIFLFGLVPLAVIVGALMAFPTCAILGRALWLVGSRVPLARPLVVWVAVAVAAALIILHFISSDPGAAGLAFIGTAVGCSAVVRSRLGWNG